MDNNPFRQNPKHEEKLNEAMGGMSLNPEDDPEQQPPPYSLPEPTIARAIVPGAGSSSAQGDGYGYPPGQEYDKDRSLPPIPRGEADSYYNNNTATSRPPFENQYSNTATAGHLSPGQAYPHYPPQGSPPVQSQSHSQSQPQSQTPAEGTSSSSFFKGLGNAFGPKRNPLDPPPPAFTRPIAYLDPRPFPPLSLQSLKTTIQDGFPMLPAAPEGALPQGTPHPFSTHDIPEADWLRFLEDISIVAKLSGGQKAKAQILPAAMAVSLPVGFLISRGIQNKMKARKAEDAAELVDTWNQFFFLPRRVRAILTHGRRILTGPEGGHSQAHLTALAYYGVQPGHHNHGHRGDSSSSSSSSSSDSDRGDHHHGHQLQSRPMSRREEKQARRELKREYREKRREDRDIYRAERRAARQQRREAKRERRHGGSSSNEKYRIILVPC